MSDRQAFELLVKRLRSLVSEYRTQKKKEPSRLSLTVSDYNEFFHAQGKTVHGDNVVPAQVPDDLLAIINMGTSEAIQEALGKYLRALLGLPDGLEVVWNADTTEVE